MQPPPKREWQPLYTWNTWNTQYTATYGTTPIMQNGTFPFYQYGPDGYYTNSTGTYYKKNSTTINIPAVPGWEWYDFQPLDEGPIHFRPYEVRTVAAPWVWIQHDANELAWQRINADYQETEDQRLAREERQRIRQAQYEMQQAEERDRRIRDAAAREGAERVARELLLANLDDQQRHDLLTHGWFEVISNTGRRWRIRSDSYSGNVDLMPDERQDNQRLASFCAHAPGWDEERRTLPKSDHLLAQKFYLETDEESFVGIANVHYLDQHRAARHGRNIVRRDPRVAAELLTA